ncbi:ABC transporter ATP-binding protein [Olleya sp. YS]|uniref:ABC transporter ATP-binding protein n=1 Tax=Olleya sp. YS TaxID=3028318 RepID=UPI002434452C|nr:ABC transporter ATP-binding protein [Olleya sp. YS]WGD34889.1 ABC transporter ATP-binding protein [Olleya sp. YS]
MSEQRVILKAENISKQYRLGLVGTGTISHDLNRWWHKVRGKEDPYLKVGESNDRSTKGDSEYVWALKDINFEVKKGEVLGIIGKNGAGKSTLLKILSKVTGPTTGEIKARGRIASLLEVGTGFHGEMTGRENVYLNGAILGMTKKEISSKIEEIIEFSGCQRYIDTPVKRYSSGMTVRLAFAVAAFLEPEILVIDEVLAVGDAEFQKKAIGKMQDISRGEGRTVLFVSHNMASVQKLCTRGLLLSNGTIAFEGPIEETIENYRKQVTQEVNKFDFLNRNRANKPVSFIGFETLNNKKEITDRLLINEPTYFEIKLSSKVDVKVTVRITIFDQNETRILAFDSRDTSTIFDLSKGENTLICSLKNGLEIKPGEYYINISVKSPDALLDHIVKVSDLIIDPTDYFNSGRLVTSDIPLILKRNEWHFTK